MMNNKMMKTVKKTVKEMVTNKYVLYTVLCLAIVNVLGFLITNNFIGLAVFALIGLLTSYFTKNMTVILLVTLAASSVLHISRMTVEAMTNKSDKKKNKKSADDADDADDADGTDDTDSVDDDVDDDADDADMKDTDDMNDEPVMKKKKHKLNHQETVQASYDNVHSILGNKNFKKMTEDTSKLLEQQNKLTESLNNMAPILQNAESMLNKFDLGQMTNMMESLNLGPSSGKKKKN
jgi:hypothetical protein